MGSWILLLALCLLVVGLGGLGGVVYLGVGLGRHGWRNARRLARHVRRGRGRGAHGRRNRRTRRRDPVVGGHPFVIALLPILVGVAALAAIFMALLGFTLARMAALADRHMPTPPHAPKTPARALDAGEIRARVLAEKWHREGRLSPAGHLRLCDMMYAGLDVYPYWSGGELHGTAVVWDGTRGPHSSGERLTVEEWNADAEHRASAQLDTGAREGEGARGGAA